MVSPPGRYYMPRVIVHIDQKVATEMERCKHEIATIEDELLAGNPDVAGLCLALSDWSAELGILEEEQEDEKRRRESARRREGNGTGDTQALTE
jgi:hypothetical protein